MPLVVVTLASLGPTYFGFKGIFTVHLRHLIENKPACMASVYLRSVMPSAAFMRPSTTSFHPDPIAALGRTASFGLVIFALYAIVLVDDGFREEGSSTS